MKFYSDMLLTANYEQLSFEDKNLIEGQLNLLVEDYNHIKDKLNPIVPTSHGEALLFKKAFSLGVVFNKLMEEGKAK